MLKVANYKSRIASHDKFFRKEINIEEIGELDKKQLYKHEILIWSNNYPFDIGELNLFPKLKVFINWGVDSNNILCEERLVERNIKLKKVDFYSTEALAEFITGAILLFERKYLKLYRGVKSLGNEIASKKVGVIGFGKIGFRSAQILKKAFSCEIFYYSTKDKKIEGYSYATLKYILQECDYLIIATKSSAEIITEKNIKWMNGKLLIVNIVDGKILTPKTIKKLIDQQKIRGYIADYRHIDVESLNVYDQVLAFGHYGYLTSEAKAIKEDILRFYLKPYMREKQNKVYLVRHGQTEWNKLGVFQGQLDSPLTCVGEQQAMSAAQLLKRRGVEHVFTSPLSRSLRTATIISETLNVPVKVVPEFKEMNFGIFQGKTASDVMKLFDDFFKNKERNSFYKLHAPYPEGESYFDVYMRVLPRMVTLLAHYDNFVIVGHESLNRVLRGVAHGLDLEEMVSLRQKHNEIVEIDLMKGEELMHSLPLPQEE